MREQFKASEGRRTAFKAKFVRYGWKPTYRGHGKRTALFIEVQSGDGKIKEDHIWVIVGKQLGDFNLKAGDWICFEARITGYQKGYQGAQDYFEDSAPRVKDYRLSFPTNFSKLTADAKQMPTNQIELFQ